MTIDPRIKKILLSSEYSSHEALEKLLSVFNVSIEDVILTVDKSDSELVEQWLEYYMLGQQEDENSFSINNKCFNHLYSLVEHKEKENLYTYYLYQSYIKIFDKDNINKLENTVKKIPDFQVAFFIDLFNKNENYKFIETSFIFELIELMRDNKNLTKAIDNDLKLPKMYLERILNSLSLAEAFIIMRRKRSSAVVELFRACCTAHQTTLCDYLAQSIKRKGNGICAIYPDNWRWIIQKEKMQNLAPVFEALGKQSNYNLWGVTKEVLDMWHNKIIIEEKNQLLFEIKDNQKTKQVVKL